MKVIGTAEATAVIADYFDLICDTDYAFDESEILRRMNANAVDAEPEWIPFKTRELTDEEKEEYPEWEIIVDCKLPENGQEILVSIDVSGHKRVQFDEFYNDDGIYLDSGYEIGTEAVAWMPLPKPYRRETNDKGKGS